MNFLIAFEGRHPIIVDGKDSAEALEATKTELRLKRKTMPELAAFRVQLGHMPEFLVLAEDEAGATATYAAHFGVAKSRHPFKVALAPKVMPPAEASEGDGDDGAAPDEEASS